MLVLVKGVIWSVSLGSGTSGGVLAPLLMMGGALGGLEALVFPHAGVGFWPLVSMGAILGGTMRSSSRTPRCARRSPAWRSAA